jgi:hypothetical protein
VGCGGNASGGQRASPSGLPRRETIPAR